jgi:hypothetical protein
VIRPDAVTRVAAIPQVFLTSCLPASLIIASSLWDFQGDRHPVGAGGQSLLDR